MSEAHIIGNLYLSKDLDIILSSIEVVDQKLKSPSEKIKSWSSIIDEFSEFFKL